MAAVVDLPLAAPTPTDREPRASRRDNAPALVRAPAGRRSDHAPDGPTGDAGPRRATDPPRSPTVPDTPEMLGDHLIPALRELGVLRATDRIRTRTRDEENRRPPPPGTVTVGLGASRIDGPPAPDEPSTQDRQGDVHVHIDRVEVVRSAPAAEPATARAAGPTAPSRLESYLEQRQASRR